MINMVAGQCCSGVQQRKKAFILSFRRPELLYDIANCSYIEGDTMATEDEHAKHLVFDVVQDGNSDRVSRVLNLAHTECVELLYPYTKEELPDGEICPCGMPGTPPDSHWTQMIDKRGLDDEKTAPEIDDVMREPDIYKIMLMLPEIFSMTTVRLLEHLIHEYLVYRVLADWLSIVKPDSAANWTEKLASVSVKIKDAIKNRTGKIRRPMKPF